MSVLRCFQALRELVESVPVWDDNPPDFEVPAFVGVYSQGERELMQAIRDANLNSKVRLPRVLGQYSDDTKAKYRKFRQELAEYRAVAERVYVGNPTAWLSLANITTLDDQLNVNSIAQSFAMDQAGILNDAALKTDVQFATDMRKIFRDHWRYALRYWFAGHWRIAKIIISQERLYRASRMVCNGTLDLLRFFEAERDFFVRSMKISRSQADLLVWLQYLSKGVTEAAGGWYLGEYTNIDAHIDGVGVALPIPAKVGRNVRDLGKEVKMLMLRAPDLRKPEIFAKAVQNMKSYAASRPIIAWRQFARIRSPQQEATRRARRASILQRTADRDRQFAVGTREEAQRRADIDAEEKRRAAEGATAAFEARRREQRERRKVDRRRYDAYPAFDYAMKRRMLEEDAEDMELAGGAPTRRTRGRGEKRPRSRDLLLAQAVADPRDVEVPAHFRALRERRIAQHRQRFAEQGLAYAAPDRKKGREDDDESME